MIYVNDVSVPHRLHRVTTEFKQGQKLHIVGPNGSGKSTLLSVLAGVLAYTGSIQFNSQELNTYSLVQLAELRSFLPQNEKPVFGVTVYQYLQMVLPVSVQFHQSVVLDVLAYLTSALKLTDKLAKSIHQLSGGEWQRVRLAGACLQVWPTMNSCAQVLLLDEPTAALDIGQEKLVYDLLDELVALGVTVVMSNHDLNRTYRHADSVVLLESGELVAAGTPSDVLVPERIDAVFATNTTVLMNGEQKYMIFD